MDKKNRCVILFTGIPCSGKSTIADNVAKYLELFDVPYERLDGDVVRETLCKGLGFSREDRDENLKRVAFVAKRVANQGSIVLCSFVSPFVEQREMVMEKVFPNHFIEVFVDADYETCMERDVKGMYKKAIQGLIKNFTGVSAEYEKPNFPQVHCQTWKESVEESTYKVLTFLKENDLI